MVQKQPRYFRNEKWNKAALHFIANTPNDDTRKIYEGTLRRLTLFVARKYGSQRTPDKFSKEDIEEFLGQPVQKNRRKGQPPSAYTVNTYLNAIRAFYLHCTRIQVDFRGKKVPLMRKDALPTDGISLAKTGDVERDMTEGEVRALFAAIDRSTVIGKRDFALFWALFVTGKRRREITNLRRGDLEQFDFDHGRGWRFHFRGKWRVTQEYAEMPQTVVDAIIDFHRAAGRDFATMGPNEPLFPAAIGIARRPISLNLVATIFRKYARAAGIPDSAVPHSLRWENAWQRYLASNKDIMLVQDQMGWKSIEQAAHYIRRRKRKHAGDPTAAALAAKFQ